MAKKGLNIYKRKDGRWEGRYKSGYTAKGKAKYSSVYGKSYSTVKEILEVKRSAVRCGCEIRCNSTVGDILNNWLADVKNKVKETTLANYEMKLKKHIIPYFGGEKYDRLTADSVNGFINLKLSEKLSAKYVSDIVLIIKSVAKFAQKRYGYANRIDSVTIPKIQHKSDQKMLTDNEQARLKKELLSKPNNTNIGILLASSTGLRIGELCALRWKDIDLEKSILTVRGTVQRIMKKEGGTKLIVTSPKSVSSNREIPLPSFIIPYLNELKAVDDCFLLSGSKKLVEPRTMQYRFKSLLKKAGLPYVNFHALRHMFATNCIALGFDVKTLSEILGHCNVQITLNKYVHSSMERKKVCMQLLSDRYAA